MKKEKRSFIESFREVRERRVHVLPNIGFASQLQQLENSQEDIKKTEPYSSLTVYLKEYCAFPGERDLIEAVLKNNNYNAVKAAREIFGGEIPRVIKGVRL